MEASNDMWIQKEIRLSPKPRGVHLVTNDILHQCPELKRLRVGMAGHDG